MVDTAVGGGDDSDIYIHDADAIVVILTARLSTDPNALFEIWSALKAGVPLIPVAITGKGYDFEEAAKTLANLPQVMETARVGSTSVLEGKLPDGTSVASLGKLVHFNLTSIIAISWNPSQGQNHMDAVVHDIGQRMQRHMRAKRWARGTGRKKSRNGGLDTPNMRTGSSRPTVHRISSREGAVRSGMRRASSRDAADQTATSSV
eukprot:5532936-Prymnesium_polylepis.1